MGLEVSHGAFHGAYSAFNRFRKVIAKATGGSFPPHDDVVQYPESEFWYVGEDYPRATHPGLWEFMAHSDCDGEISPRLCKLVADELEALLPKIALWDGGGAGHIAFAGGYVQVTLKFIRGCRAAHARNEPLVFE